MALSPFTAFSVATSALRIFLPHGFCMLAGSVSLVDVNLATTKQTDECRHSLNCPRYCNSFLQGKAPRGDLVPDSSDIV